MNEKLIRTYTKHNAAVISRNLLIYGDLSGNCGHCQAMDIKLDEVSCPKCGNAFKYISFRNIKSHLPKAYMLIERRPDVTLVDFEDYNRELGASKAKEFLK